jgi:alpha-tubulin suppressor-like RCC1 family protein
MKIHIVGDLPSRNKEIFMLKNRFLLVLLLAALMLTMTPFIAAPVSAAKFTATPMVAAGGFHSFALKDDGTVWAWGSNLNGQLGDGTTTNRLIPVQVKGEGGVGHLTDVKAIAAGEYHSMALESNGTVWAWGTNYYGQIGNGENGSDDNYADAVQPTPVKVMGLSNVSAIAAGVNHSLALKKDGTVWAWGLNYYGQLGDGTTVDKNTSVQIKGLSNVAAIAAGDFYSFAVKKDGTVWAWGSNLNGQLGDGTKTDSFTPVRVKGEGGKGNLTGVTSMSGGAGHSLALKKDGTVWAWGFNGFGQLGDGTKTDSLTPAPVKGEGGKGNLTHVKALVAGTDAYHSLALKKDGTVWAWGYNEYGQLGDGAATPSVSSLTPVQVKGEGGKGNLTGVTSMAGGVYHSLALTSDCTVLAWGINWSGQLGDGTTAQRNAPVKVAGEDDGDFALCSPVTTLTAGCSHSLALDGSGNVWSWGRNNNGQLGDGTKTNRRMPVPVLVKDIDGLTPLSGVTQFAAGGAHSLALKDNTVLAWGWNSFGQLGDGTKTSRHMPVQVKVKGDDGSLTPLSDVAALAAGGYHSLALKEDGTVWSWGKNNNGQLGDGTKTNRLTPVKVERLYGITAIAAGCSHSLALDKEGIVWAWGYNKFGQLGDGTKINRLTPVQVEGLYGIAALAAGGDHSLAIQNTVPLKAINSLAIANGKAFSWGRNNNGQLGDGTKINRLIPTPVELSDGVTSLAAGGFHSMALKDNEVWTWGRNTDGQLGNGTTKVSLIPRQIDDLSANILVSGYYHSLVLKDNGEVWSWGRNSSGQLGDGTTKRHTVPAQVKGE